jgi:hypothetical protein
MKLNPKAPWYVEPKQKPAELNIWIGKSRGPVASMLKGKLTSKNIDKISLRELQVLAIANFGLGKGVLEDPNDFKERVRKAVVHYEKEWREEVAKVDLSVLQEYIGKWK